MRVSIFGLGIIIMSSCTHLYASNYAQNNQEVVYADPTLKPSQSNQKVVYANPALLPAQTNQNVVYADPTLKPSQSNQEVVYADPTLKPTQKNQEVVYADPALMENYISNETTFDQSETITAFDESKTVSAFDEPDTVTDDLEDKKIHDEMFVVKDQFGRPIPNFPYKIVTGEGDAYRGYTNKAGETIRVTTGYKPVHLCLHMDLDRPNDSPALIKEKTDEKCPASDE